MSETLAIQVMEALARRDVAFVKAYSTDDATASGGILPGSMPLGDAMGVMGALWAALSDFHVEISSVVSKGAETTVAFKWGGMHDGVLTLPLPGMGAIAPTGKPVWVRDAFTFHFVDDKLSAVRVESPTDGGIPGMIAQIGVLAQ